MQVLRPLSPPALSFGVHLILAFSLMLASGSLGGHHTLLRTLAHRGDQQTLPGLMVASDSFN